MNRRTALSALAAAALTPGALPRGRGDSPAARVPGGRLKQSVCKWCYPGLTVDQLSREAKAMGLASVELLGETEWAMVRRHGLVCAMANGPSTIGLGWNRPDQHDRLVRESERLLPLAAEAGCPNLIVFSGNRAGLSDGEGIEHCARGLARVAPVAEPLGVTLCLELLNSKVDHPDYQADHTAWGVEVVKRVGSPRCKLLYDIYHMQIMEGDVIQTIRDHIAQIAHFHTGGVPGRHELDETQELNYRAVMTAIADLGFQGYIGQEFIPSPGRDPLASLRHGVAVCDV